MHFWVLTHMCTMYNSAVTQRLCYSEAGMGDNWVTALLYDIVISIVLHSRNIDCSLLLNIFSTLQLHASWFIIRKSVESECLQFSQNSVLSHCCTSFLIAWCWYWTWTNIMLKTRSLTAKQQYHVIPSIPHQVYQRHLGNPKTNSKWIQIAENALTS